MFHISPPSSRAMEPITVSLLLGASILKPHCGVLVKQTLSPPPSPYFYLSCYFFSSLHTPCLFILFHFFSDFTTHMSSCFIKTRMEGQWKKDSMLLKRSHLLPFYTKKVTVPETLFTSSPVQQLWWCSANPQETETGKSGL